MTHCGFQCHYGKGTCDGEVGETEQPSSWCVVERGGAGDAEEMVRVTEGCGGQETMSQLCVWQQPGVCADPEHTD